MIWQRSSLMGKWKQDELAKIADSDDLDISPFRNGASPESVFANKAVNANPEGQTV
jgi:hypothetical protein